MATTNQKVTVPGYNTTLAMAFESNFGTVAAPTVYLPFTEHTLDPQNKLINNEAVRHSAGTAAPGIGTVEISGDVTLNADIDSIGLLICAGMGANSDTVSAAELSNPAASAFYKHSFLLGANLNSYTFSADDNNGSVSQFVGSKVSQLDFSCKPAGFLELKATVSGQTNVVMSGSLGSVTYSTRNPFEWAHLNAANGGSTLINGTQVDLQDFTITLKNTLKTNWGSSGGRFLVNNDLTQHEVSGTFTVNYDSISKDAIQLLLWGSTTGPAAGVLQRVPLSITFAQPDGSTLTLTCGNITLESAGRSRKRGDVISQAVKFMASESTTGAADDLTIALYNTASTPYS